MTIQTLDYVFNRDQHQPSFGQMPPVPAASYSVRIDEVEIKELSENKGYSFSVSFVILSGEYAGRKIFNNYNLWHATSADSVRISHEQLSALCWVTDTHDLDFRNGGKSIVGKTLVLKVDNDGKRNNVKEYYTHSGLTGFEVSKGITVPAVQSAPVAVVNQPATAPIQPVNTAPIQPQLSVMTTVPQISTFSGTVHPVTPQPVATGWGQPV